MGNQRRDVVGGGCLLLVVPVRCNQMGAFSTYRLDGMSLPFSQSACALATSTRHVTDEALAKMTMTPYGYCLFHFLRILVTAISSLICFFRQGGAGT